MPRWSKKKTVRLAYEARDETQISFLGHPKWIFNDIFQIKNGLTQKEDRKMSTPWTQKTRWRGVRHPLDINTHAPASTPISGQGRHIHLGQRQSEPRPGRQHIDRPIGEPSEGKGTAQTKTERGTPPPSSPEVQILPIWHWVASRACTSRERACVSPPEMCHCLCYPQCHNGGGW